MGIVDSTIYGLIVGGGIKYMFSSIEAGLKLDYLINFNKIAVLPSRPTRTGYTSEAQVYDQTLLLKFTIAHKIFSNSGK